MRQESIVRADRPLIPPRLAPKATLSKRAASSLLKLWQISRAENRSFDRAPAHTDAFRVVCVQSFQTSALWFEPTFLYDRYSIENHSCALKVCV